MEFIPVSVNEAAYFVLTTEILPHYGTGDPGSAFFNFPPSLG
jgi:hypothetical protein